VEEERSERLDRSVWHACTPIHKETRLQIEIGMEIGIVNAKVVGLFSNETFETRPRTVIHDSDFHSDNRFESYLLENWLYTLCVASMHTRGLHFLDLFLIQETVQKRPGNLGSLPNFATP